MTGSLLFGAFELVDQASGTAQPWKSKVLTEGTNRGNPVPIEVEVQSWLQDGAIVVTQGYNNREVPVRVKLTGDTADGLPAAEAALFAEIGKPNTLTWTPSVPLARPTVFVVITSSLGRLYEAGWDNAEVAGTPSAKYTIQLVCEAFVRSPTETVAVALPTSGATNTLLDACSANTGWTGFINGVSATVTNAGGANSVTQTAAFGTFTVAMQKTFAATTTSTKLLVVDWKPSIFAKGSLVATGDGVILPLMSEIASPTAGYVRSYFYVAAAALAVTRFEWTSAVSGWLGTAPARTLSIDNVAVTDIRPSFGTGRQQMRSLAVGGAARAPGSLAVESTTAALGDGTLVYCFPTTDETFGYSPPLRQYRIAGNTVTADAAMVSGSREPLTAPGVTFSIPVGLLPAGAYLLVARVALASSSGSGIFAATTQTVLGGNNVGVATLNSGSVPLTTSYTTVVLMRLSLPTVDLDQATPASVQLTLAMTGSWINTVNLDEAWLFNTTIGQLTWVDCGTGAGAAGGSARRLFIDPASPLIPRPLLRIGHSADRSDSFYPVGAVKSWQRPIFKNGQVNALTVTPNAGDATLTLKYFKRWPTSAAESS